MDNSFYSVIWNSQFRYVLMFFGAFMIIYIPCMMLWLRRKKQKAADFLERNPTAAKTFVKNAGGTLMILAVDGAKPDIFIEGIKSGFFLLPGEHTVQFQYSWTRPGILYKTVTTTVGPTDVRVTAEANKNYEIRYDKKVERGRFEEVF